MAQLTEQEKREVIRSPEAGKHLFDKYRFLLFDEKREVELAYIFGNDTMTIVEGTA